MAINVSLVSLRGNHTMLETQMANVLVNKTLHIRQNDKTMERLQMDPTLLVFQQFIARL